MVIAKILTQSPYGAFELKRSYQKNMFTGTLISGSISLLVIAIFMIIAFIRGLTGIPIASPLETERKIKVEVPPPQNIKVKHPESNISVQIKIPAFGVLNPVPDSEEYVTNVVLSRHDRELLVPRDHPPGNGGGSGEIIYDFSAITGKLIPPADSLISRTKDPVLIHAPVPDYPKLAQDAGVEGMVIIQVYIDTDGKVVDARVAKPAKSDVGFDQAALAAAWGRVYSPAMQNKQPVGVWMSYAVRFEIGE